MAPAAHRRIYEDPAARVAFDADRARNQARDDPGGEHDRAGVDGFAVDVDTSRFDRPHRCGCADVTATAAKDLPGDAPESFVDLRQDARAGLEEPEVQLVAADPRVKTQHVVRKGAEFAEQFDANEPAADHHNRQGAAACRRLAGGIGELQLFDYLIA